MVYMNPPFSLFPQAVQKILDDQVHAMVVMPDWVNEKWHKRLMQHTLASVIFLKGCKVFELNGWCAKAHNGTQGWHWYADIPPSVTPLSPRF